MTDARKTTKGFTLIELLVVISIIWLLSSVVLTTVNEVRAKARDAQRIQALNEVKNALSLYYADNEEYPIPPRYYVVPYDAYFFAESTTFLVNNAWNKLETDYLQQYISVLPTNMQGVSNPGSLSPYVLWFGTTYNYSYFSTSDGSQYQMFTRLETSHPLRCAEKDYEAKFDYKASWGSSVFPTNRSFCSGAYAESNANLYVVSSE